MEKGSGQALHKTRPLWRVTGFLPFIAVAFINALLDLGHKILIQNTLFKSYDGPEQVLLTAIVNSLILLPFILLYTPSGFLSDRFAKPRIMRYSAAVALVLTLLITLSYYQGWFYLSFGLTFLLAAQSALYSPAKYGYVRELVGAENLSVANSWIQGATMIAILTGIVLFSLLFEQRLALTPQVESTPRELLQQAAPLGWLLVLLAVVELLLAMRLKGGESHPQLRLDRQDYLRGRLLRRNLHRVTGRAPILWSVIGLALFWSISQVMVAVYPAYVKQHLGEMNTFLVQGAMAFAGIGILFGSILAARLSRGYINTGLIPVGATVLAVALLILPGSRSLLDAGVLFFLVGLGGALAIVPLNALIQFHAPEEESGSILAGNNFLQNVAMLISLLATVVSAWFALPARLMLIALALVAVAGAVLAVWRLPESLLRLLVRLLLRTRYRLDVLGFEHLPAEGRGVLLLGNHISWLDWAIVQLGCPRHVHFVMERALYERWYLRWLFKLYRVIPVSAGGSRDALHRVASLLSEGKVVCLFPEGAISYSGQLGEFKRGFERIARQSGVEQAVILPFYLRGLWGSRFSRSSTRMQLNTRVSGKRTVIVAYGAPMAITSSAVEVKKTVSELAIQAWQRFTDELETLPEAFLRTARSRRCRWAITELKGPPLSCLKLLTGCALFARHLRHCRGERVGVLLPTSVGGVIANMALLMCGRTLVELNYTASISALLEARRRSGVETLVTSRLFLQKLKQRGIDVSPLLEGCEVIELETVRDGLSGRERLLTLLAVRLLPLPLLRLWLGGGRQLDDTAAILFSSGSEGAPKGVMLSHRNIMANLKQIADVLNIRDDDCVVATLPMFHAFGLTATCMMPLIEGVPIVCHPDPTDAVGVGKAVARYRATLLCGTSTLFRLYARHSRLLPAMFQSLRYVVAGAERLAPEVRDQFETRFHKRILEGYGCTETTPVASVNLPDHLNTQYWMLQVGQKVGTVGLALPGSWFRVVDPVTFEQLPVGEAGMVLIGGTQIMQGYLDEPERTARAVIERDGIRWYVTGDKGYLDEDGFLTLIDRYSRFAKIGGEMISLGAVESEVRRYLPEDMTVLATAIPDARKGEQICLLVEGDSAEGVRERLIAAGVPPLMLPTKVFAVAKLPFLGSGKPDLAAVKALALDLNGV